MSTAQPSNAVNRATEATDTQTYDEPEDWEQAVRDVPPEQVEAIRTCPSILDRFIADMEEAGLAGETRLAKLTYLALTSRLFERPVSLAIMGPSAGGKSQLVARVLAAFPPPAYLHLAGMSKKALAYLKEPLSHRFLIINESAGLMGGFQAYLLRTLLSEGHLEYATVVPTSNGPEIRFMKHAGPTGLITTTTATKLDPELDTRLITLSVNDSAEQTKRILVAEAREQDADVSPIPWIAFQIWLEGQDRRFVVPFAERLAGLIPPASVRLRRDFKTLLALIRAHALLHVATRAKDEQGRIIATIADYEAVRSLVADIIAEGIDRGVDPIVRETVHVVDRLLRECHGDVRVQAIATALRIDKSAASRRVLKATQQGFLANLEPSGAKPARVVLGDPLPVEGHVLPEAGVLSGCTVASVSADGATPEPEVARSDAAPRSEFKRSSSDPLVSEIPPALIRDEAWRMEAIERLKAARGHEPMPASRNIFKKEI